MPDPSPIGSAAPPCDWASLIPGTHVTVVKLAPDGTEAARYAGEVVATYEPGAWVIVRATWTFRPIEIDGLQFMPGDELLEWFSPQHPFNAFAVFSPRGQFRGWYANVTRPAFLRPANGLESDKLPVLVWHDMYLDLVGLPDGCYALRDEDELLASSLSVQDPELFESVKSAGETLQRRFSAALPPFVATAELTDILSGSLRKSWVR
jgi:hypothetical protein